MTTTRRSAPSYHSSGLLTNQILKVRLRGEVHRLVAPRDQKYQSNFVEVCCCERLCALRLTLLEHSSGTTRSFTGAMQGYSFVFV